MNLTLGTVLSHCLFARKDRQKLLRGFDLAIYQITFGLAGSSAGNTTIVGAKYQGEVWLAVHA